MTKRRNMLTEAVSKGVFSPAGFGPAPLSSLVFACMIGMGFALSTQAGTLPEPVTQVGLKISDRWHKTVAKLPKIPAPVTGKLWPAWLASPEHVFGSGGTGQQRPASIAIVIDDGGADRARTADAMGLPDAVTLSFLPYPPATPRLSHDAHEAGHEIILHLPMEALGGQNPGPNALTVDADAAEISRRLDWNLSQVKDYDGVNNHMGSRFTASRQALLPVMKQLAERHLFFLDSRTTPKTQAEKVAREAGVLTGRRDIFLDTDAASVERQLALVEARARAEGVAIAIGHPYARTISALKRWAQDLPARGFQLVSLKTALQMRNKEGQPWTVSASLRGPIR